MCNDPSYTLSFISSPPPTTSPSSSPPTLSPLPPPPPPPLSYRLHPGCHRVVHPARESKHDHSHANSRASSHPWQDDPLCLLRAGTQGILSATGSTRPVHGILKGVLRSVEGVHAYMCCVALPCCLFDLFFLPSHLSLKPVHPIPTHCVPVKYYE